MTYEDRPILIEIRRAARLRRDRTLIWQAWQSPEWQLDFTNVAAQIHPPYVVTWTGFGPRGGRHLLRTYMSPIA